MDKIISSANWYIFSGNKLLLKTDSRAEDGFSIPRAESPEQIGLRILRTSAVPSIYGCFSGAEAPEESTAPAGYQFVDLRTLAGLMDERDFSVTAKAYQLINWESTHRYCPRCAAELEHNHAEGSKVCTSCGMHLFPTISPAIIIAVIRKNTLLLAHNAKFREGLFSLIAGFMEPGETIEACAVREVYEETGIHIKNVSYFGSQPWPFPHSLMIGLTGEYAEGSITPDGDEITEAHWFTKESMPKLPGKGSISRRLIDHTLELFS